MRRFLHRALAVACACTLAVPLAASPADVDTVLGRLRERLVAQRVDRSRAEAWLGGLGADGRWTDVDYRVDMSRQKAYAPSAHQERCRALALLLARREGDPSLILPKLSSALAHNLTYTHDPRFTWDHDWYATHIVVPGQYAEVLLLLDGILPRKDLLTFSAHLRDGLQVPRADGKPFQFKGTAQNLVWVSRVSMAKAAVERNEALMQQAFAAAFSTVSYQRAGVEGIKVDGMFHQHGRQLYNGGYGLSFVSDIVASLRFSEGTVFAREFRNEQLALFRHMLLQGHQWATYRDVMDFGSRGRTIARPRSEGAVRAADLEFLATFDTRSADKYRAWIDHSHGGPFPEPGNRHFWKSDFMVHRGQDWYVSAKVLSPRTAGTETMNGENLLGYNLPLGATCVMTTGREYAGIYPVWDWSRIPGTTAARGVERPAPHVFKGSNPFAGGASDGRSGVLAFQSEYEGLRASKAYFGIGDGFVCLTAGVSWKDKQAVVATSLNQCLLNGPVWVDGQPLKEGRATGALRAIHHDGVGYVLLDAGARAEVRAAQQSGSWKRISSGQSAEPLTKEVFNAWVEHAPADKASGSRCAYLVVPGVDIKTFAGLSGSHGYEVLRNDEAVQAVTHRGRGVLGAVFYKAGQFSAGGGVTVAADGPAVVLVARTDKAVRVWVGDPRCEARPIRVALGGRMFTATPGSGDELGKCVEAAPIQPGGVAGSRSNKCRQHDTHETHR